MTADEREFLASFEAGMLSPEAFHHRDHVRLAWIFLRNRTLLEALEGFSTGLRRFAEMIGKPGLYHETITWALLLVIHERIVRGAEDDYESFEANNPDLLVWPSPILKSYYTKETLESDRARRNFLLPDHLKRMPRSLHTEEPRNQAPEERPHHVRQRTR